MANTTDLMITSLFDDDAIAYINERTGLDFQQLTDGDNAGGAKILSFEAFGTCPRCIGKDRIKELIAAFKEAPFGSPEYAVLFINDDDTEEFDGLVILCS